MTRALLFGWLVAGALLALAFPFARFPWAIPLVIATTVLAWALARRRSPAVRRALDRVDLRWVVLAHALRAPIGVAFLVLHDRGVLPEAFAVRGGWGDIAAGALALAVSPLARAASGASLTGSRRAALLAWNALSFADIALVVGTAQVLVFGRHDPQLLAALAHPVFALLPTLVVPFVIATHLLVFARLLPRRAAGAIEPAVSEVRRGGPP